MYLYKLNAFHRPINFNCCILNAHDAKLRYSNNRHMQSYAYIVTYTYTFVLTSGDF